MSVGGFSHFSFLFPSHVFFFLISTVFPSVHRSSSHFLPLPFKRESILREAFSLLRPLIPCLFIFSPVFSFTRHWNVKHTIISLSLPYPFQLPISPIFLFSSLSLPHSGYSVSSGLLITISKKLLYRRFTASFQKLIKRWVLTRHGLIGVRPTMQQMWFWSWCGKLGQTNINTGIWLMLVLRSSR